MRKIRFSSFLSGVAVNDSWSFRFIRSATKTPRVYLIRQKLVILSNRVVYVTFYVNVVQFRYRQTGHNQRQHAVDDAHPHLKPSEMIPLN